MTQHPIGILPRLWSSIRRDGLAKTLIKCIRNPFRKPPLDVMKDGTPLQIFSTIYENGYWGTESVSGPGSTLEYTASLRRHLPQLFKELAIGSVFDAPCGDFNWMKSVIQQSNITYFGADIVPAMIEKLQRQYGTSKISFRTADITSDRFPKVDLWICRDCFFHLSYRDILLALRNFLASGTPLVLTTTDVRDAPFKNTDTRTGAKARDIDLFLEPYFFPPEVLARIPDWVEPWPKREMCLWTRQQIAASVQRMEKALKEA